MFIEVDPHIYDCFMASTAVSGKYPSRINMGLSILIYFLFIVSKGISSHLLKVGAKRRRSGQEVKMAREEAASKQKVIEKATKEKHKLQQENN